MMILETVQYVEKKKKKLVKKNHDLSLQEKY